MGQVDELAALVNFNTDAISLSADDWASQWKEAIVFEGKCSNPAELAMYLLALPWKVPPSSHSLTGCVNGLH